MELQNICTDRRRSGLRVDPESKEVRGRYDSDPTEGASTRRSASPVIIQSAGPQTASSSTWSSLGSRQVRIDSVISTKWASRSSSPRNRSLSLGVTYRSNFGRDTTS